MTITQNGQPSSAENKLRERAQPQVVLTLDELRERNASGLDGKTNAKRLAPTGGADDKPPRLDQPLLLIACGGSGCMIATQLKAIWIETFGRMPENAIILGFDSADDPIAYREHRYGHVVTLERGSEFIRLKRVPVSGIKRNLQHHPELTERLGENIHRIQRPIIDNGAAMERPQGLLAVVWNASHIERILDNALHRLTQRNGDLRYDFGREGGINVVVVGSTAGGQGSGALLDLTYMARKKLTELGDLDESSRVVGMFVLPGAFAGVKGPNLLPNSYAFFLELDSLMQGQEFIARYPGDQQIRSKERPFHYVYVLDGVDEQGRTWPNREEVCALGAQTLALLFSTAVGLREINNLVNESGVLQNFSDQGFGTYLATAGQAVIRFPATQVASRCALRQAQAMIEHLLAIANATSANNNQTGALPVDLATVAGISTVRDRLYNTQNGAPFQARLTVPAGLEQAPPEEIPTQARNLFANYLQRRIYDQDFAQMKEQAEQLQTTLQNELSQQLSALLEAGYLAQALTWLHYNQSELDRRIVAVVSDQDRLARLVEQAQTALDDASTALDRAADSFIVFRRNQVRGALSTYLNAANEMAQLRLEQRVEQLVGEVVRQAAQWVHQHLHLVELVTIRLQQTHEWLTAHEVDLAHRVGGHSEITLAEPELIDHFYQTYAGNPQADVQMTIQQSQGLLQWADQAPEQLAQRFMQSADHHFAPIMQMTVEHVLALRWHERSAQQWIGRLQALAAGGWNLDQSLLTSGGVDLASFLTLGVPDERNSIFANSGHTLVSTHDPERIIALRTIYGASFDTLKSALLWKQAYVKVAGRTPLHILQQFQRGDDRSVQLFALGLIFNQIYNQATWFYGIAKDELEAPIRLGQGLENALATFRERPTLQAQVLNYVETQIATAGIVKAIEAIERYVETGGKQANHDETTKKLRRAARDYVTELRRQHREIGNS